ncbi:mechanosensitive ion channel [Flavobacterium azooxidireducens]|uniref:Mechanosensitive ion channel n=1 Tax=Flavobacterium azooxidireducens TaxID=1871076 RepID=A0ABY4KH12_9FLAO|nr:mechanosensitive ion channel domain-containing protein [Flavobacterium azooxidireducens]UPQ80094.1 mechanosensitive ion channel [Flavobacterium azooxidireducens]
MDLIVVNTDYVTKYWDYFTKVLMEYSPRLISATIILVIGWTAIRLIKKLIMSIMTKRDMEPTLSKFLADILIWTLKILLFVTVISRLGVENSSFVAIIGAAGLAIGLSLQGSLSNFAGGVLIIMFKPFKVGDFIEAQGVSGTVKQIQIFVTQLATVDNQIIFVPNGALSNGTIINYSYATTRRANLVIGISYGSDIKKAKQIAMEVMENHPSVLKDPAPVVLVSDLADSSINLAVRPWANLPDFFVMRSDILEQVKLRFDENGIEIPFPQRDIHIKEALPKKS